MNDTSWSYLKDWDLLINITDVLIDMGTYPVTRHDIAGIWVAFFQGCRQYRGAQGKQGNLSSPAYERLHAYPCPGMPPLRTKQCGIMVRSLPPSLSVSLGPIPLPSELSSSLFADEQRRADRRARWRT